MLNVDWLHCLSNTKWALYSAHAKSGHIAMSEINELTQFTGIPLEAGS